jgi:voltage-dependent calcium channel alpha-2/delta-3
MLLVVVAIFAVAGGARAQSLAQLEAKVKEAAVFMEKKFDKNAVSQEGGCSKPLEGCNFGDGTAYGATCDVRYGKDSYCSCGQRRVSRSQEVTVYAPGVDGEDKDFVNCNTGNLAQDFNGLAGSELLFLYAGFQSGVHKSWPGQNWQMTADSAGCRQPGSTCSEYDPRFRNWYVSAATGPKNVVLVLDVSGSMTTAGRISKMKDAATSVVKTLSFADYVGIVTYSSDAQVGLAASSLQQADNLFRGNLTNYVNSLNAAGATNMEAGFDKAFGLLDESLKNGKTSNCHNVILFLSDGDITEGKDGGALVSFVNERNTPDLDARIFTYAFGDDIKTTVLKDIACQNKGLYARVPDSSDGETSLRTVMGGYYEYFATAVDQAEDAQAAWAEPFLDCCGMGTITTVSWPFYHEVGSQAGSAEGVRRLLGVIGSSVPLAMVGNTTLQDLLGRSKTCYTRWT